VCGDDGYALSITRAIELFQSRQPDLCDFIAQLEHLIIDEAQDVVDIRADLIMAMLKCLSETCGVTILADPAQAIYGFTSDESHGEERGAPLLSRLERESPHALIRRRLTKIYRVKNNELLDVFLRTRKKIEQAESAEGHVADVQQTIRETCGEDVGVTNYSNLSQFLSRIRSDSTLVLFRRRADVLFASSYCSEAGIEHRLRMSYLPVFIRPWLGCLLGTITQSILTRDEFDKLWDSSQRVTPAPFSGEHHDKSWELLHRIAAGRRPESLDLVHLRNVVARARPPIEFCYPDLGTSGPILGTIHASKGREADTVILVMPPADSAASYGQEGTETAAVFEEGRVYYVGATRARKMLVAAGSSVTRVSYLDSRRVYRFLGSMRVQVEIGRDGDLDRTAHLAWSNATEIQQELAAAAGRTFPIRGISAEEEDYAQKLILPRTHPDGVTRYTEIGQMGDSFRYDMRKLWSRVDTDHRLRPSLAIPHLYLVGVTTVALSEVEREAVRPPFRQSGLALAPVVKGFPSIQFVYRSSGYRR
jgi:hypothetical protein